MSDVFRLQRGAAMSTLFFGSPVGCSLGEASSDRAHDDQGGPDATRVTPVTWHPARVGRDHEEEAPDSRGY
jgi:hypothetical protein